MPFLPCFYFKQFLLLFLDSSIKSPGFFIIEAETLTVVKQSFSIVHLKLCAFTYENKKVSFFKQPVLGSALQVWLSSECSVGGLISWVGFNPLLSYGIHLAIEPSVCLLGWDVVEPNIFNLVTVYLNLTTP